MLMFTHNSRFNKLWLSALLLAGLVSLQGCGGSRDEPFNPADPVEEDSDAGKASVTIEDEHFGTNPLRLTSTEGSKRLGIITTEADYFDILTDYIEVAGVEPPNFSTGQVVYYDAGPVNGNPCVHKLTYNSISALQENDNVVKVIIKYNDVRPTTDTTCDDEMENPTRPFHFFYLHSRDSVIISERVPVSSSRSSSSRSSSQSSSSSSI